MTPVTPVGRRARHKRQTREAIEATAAALFAEHGYDGTTVAMIAEGADVSERTFFRYFESKDDLLLADVVRLLDDVVRELSRRPAGERPLRAVCAAVLAVSRRRGGGPTALGVAQLAELERPRSAARIFAVLMGWESEVAAMLSERSGSATPASQLQAQVAACAATAGLRCAVQQVAAAGRTRSTRAAFERAVARVFEELDAGCAPATG